jgi:hypothetical protein
MTAAEVAAGWHRTGIGAVQVRRSLIGLALIAIALTGLLRPAAQPDFSAVGARETSAPAPISVAGNNDQNVRDAYARLPLAFVPNAGQTDARVRFSTQTAGARFYFTEKEAVFTFADAGGRDRGIALRLAFVGANPDTRLEGRGALTGKVNYIIGSDPDEWYTNLPTYRQVVYHDLWPGIDMVFRGDASRLKYEFVLRPGAKVEDIRLAYRGADGLAVANGGQLLIGTAAGTLTDVRPVSYQEVGGRRVPIESRFLLQPDAAQATAYGFAVGDYDRSQPLVIDPGLLYSTYLGAGNTDIGNPIAIDGAGNAYVTGETDSSAFPTTAGAFDTSWNGNFDVFVTKLNATGSSLVYSTFLGGGQADRGFGIAVDATGNAYVTGRTESNNFPTTPGAHDTTYNSGGDAFMTKLNAAGSAPLLYSTYLGGGSSDEGSGIAIDAAGRSYVVGETNSNNFPTTIGAFDTSHNGGFDAFVTKLDPVALAPLAYSTYLGGNNPDRGFAVAVDGGGSAYVTGETNSMGFPTMLAFDPTNNSFDAFVTKLNPTGSSLVYSTFLGGSNPDRGFGIAVDGGGSAYLTGETQSGNFPTTAGAFDTSANGGTDAYVTKLNATGSALAYSGYLGGSGDDRGFGVAVDVPGDAYVTGETDSTNFPTTAGAADTTKDGIDAFVTRVNSAGSALVYSTFLGGSNADRGFGIVVDGVGNAYITGETQSSDFPTTAGAYDTTFNGNRDAFVTKLDTTTTRTTSTTVDCPASTPANAPATCTVTVKDTAAGTKSPPLGTVDAEVTAGPPDSTATVTDCALAPVATTPATDDSSCTITFTADTLGSYTIEATYQPAPGSVHASSSGTDAITVIARSTSTTVDCPASTPANAPATCTVTVTDIDAAPKSPPQGTVDLEFTAQPAGSSPTLAPDPCPLTTASTSSSTCTFTFNSTKAGDYTIKGTYVPAPASVHAASSGSDKITVTAGPPKKVIVKPPTATNVVETEHCVTATVTDEFDNPNAGVKVFFTVTGVNSASGTGTTGADGTTGNFCYTGLLFGTDTIKAVADANGNNAPDAGEPTGAATKIWTLPLSTAFCVVDFVTYGIRIVAANGDLGTGGGNARVDGERNPSGQHEYQDHGPVQPMNVHSISVLAVVCSDIDGVPGARQAQIYGRATIDGAGEFAYRIHVEDRGEPGTSDKYWILLSNGYDSGSQTLIGGNVQIH